MNDNMPPLESPQRPTILLVLCVLTLIGTGLGLMSDLLNLLGVQFSNDRILYPLYIPALGVPAAGAKIAGAVFMLKLKRLGFYLYAGGEAIIATLAMLSGKIQVDYFNAHGSNSGISTSAEMMAIVLTGIWLVLSLAFLLIYASMLKHMD
jgi:hypothetical protein